MVEPPWSDFGFLKKHNSDYQRLNLQASPDFADFSKS